jgi:hypothetical protein
MPGFIELTAPSGRPLYLQPDDVKAVKAATVSDSTLILLYGAEAVWLEVTETPAQVIAGVQGALAPVKFFPGTFPGRD